MSRCRRYLPLVDTLTCPSCGKEPWWSLARAGDLCPDCDMPVVAPVAEISEQTGCVHRVYLAADHFELRSPEYSVPLHVEPRDLLHEVTERGILRVSSGRTVFGVRMTEDALETLHSLAWRYALLPLPKFDPTRSRPSGLAS